MTKNKPKLPGKCYVDGTLYRPSLDEVRAHYSREDILDEILGAMAVWRVRLEPGKGMKHRWLNINDRDELRGILMKLMDRMDGNKELVKFPYFRIDGWRYEPVTSQEDDHLWGVDVMMEKDGQTWRECWDAVTPMIKILDHFGVHYWLKYTGHHSLHVMIPAESFPARIGELSQVEYAPILYRRMVAFFARFCFQPVEESGFHGAKGTNMPYSLNEDTGLLNYPVLKEEIQAFDPVKAHPDNAKIRSFWREFPDEKRGSAAGLIQEILKPVDEQRSSYEGIPDQPPMTLAEILNKMDSSLQQIRKEAVVRLHWFNDPEAKERLLSALQDKGLRVKKAAIKALAVSDAPRCEEALHSALADNNPKLNLLIKSVREHIVTIKALRESYQS